MGTTMLIDVHCHIIPGVDDGAKNINIALDMCKIAQVDGTHGIIATPHYIHGVINNSLEVVHEKVAELNNHLRQQQIAVDIYPGSEVFICPELPQLVREGRICTLNNSRYILMELPLNSIPEYTIEVIYQLRLEGYIPIIAHPERNLEIANNPNILYDLITRGALAQINAPSLRGLFGKSAMDTALQLLKRNMVHLLATDAHTTGGRSPRLSNSIDIIENKLGPETLLAIAKNGLLVLNNQPVDFSDPILVRNNRWFSFSTIFKE
jgi:protein-tyrosine phosphatase